MEKTVSVMGKLDFGSRRGVSTLELLEARLH